MSDGKSKIQHNCNDGGGGVSTIACHSQQLLLSQQQHDDDESLKRPSSSIRTTLLRRILNGIQNNPFYDNNNDLQQQEVVNGDDVSYQQQITTTTTDDDDDVVLKEQSNESNNNDNNSITRTIPTTTPQQQDQDHTVPPSASGDDDDLSVKCQPAPTEDKVKALPFAMPLHDKESNEIKKRKILLQQLQEDILNEQQQEPREDNVDDETNQRKICNNNKRKKSNSTMDNVVHNNTKLNEYNSESAAVRSDSESDDNNSSDDHHHNNESSKARGLGKRQDMKKNRKRRKASESDNDTDAAAGNNNNDTNDTNNNNNNRMTTNYILFGELPDTKESLIKLVYALRRQSGRHKEQLITYKTKYKNLYHNIITTTLNRNDKRQVNHDTDDDNDDDDNNDTDKYVRPCNKTPNTINGIIKLIYQLRQQSIQYKEQVILYKKQYTTLNTIAQTLKYMKGKNNNDGVDNKLLNHKYYKTVRTDHHKLLHDIKNIKRKNRMTTCDSNIESDKNDSSSDSDDRKHHNQSSKAKALIKIQDMKNRKRNTIRDDSESNNNNDSSYDNNSDNDNDMDTDNNDNAYQQYSNKLLHGKLPDTKESLIKLVQNLRKQSKRHKEQYVSYKKRYQNLYHITFNNASKVNDMDDDIDDDTDDDTNDNAVQQSQHTTRPWKKLPNTKEALIKLIYHERQEWTQYREQFILYKKYYTSLNKITLILNAYKMEGTTNTNNDVDDKLLNQYYEIARTDRRKLIHDMKNSKRKTTCCDNESDSSDDDDNQNVSSKARALKNIHDKRNRKTNDDSESYSNDSSDNDSDDDDMDNDNDNAVHQYQNHRNDTNKLHGKLPDKKEALIKLVYQLRRQSGRRKEQFISYKKQYKTLYHNITITQSSALKLNDTSSKVNDTDDDDTDDDTDDNAAQQSQNTRPWKKLPKTIDAIIKLIYQLRQQSLQYKEYFILYKKHCSTLNKISFDLNVCKMNGCTNTNDVVDNNDQLLNQYYETARTDRRKLIQDMKNSKIRHKKTCCDNESDDNSDGDHHHNVSSKATRALRKKQDMKNRKRNIKTDGYDSESDNNDSSDNNSDNDNDVDMDMDNDNAVQQQYSNKILHGKLPDTKESLIKLVHNLRKQSGRHKKQFISYKKRYQNLYHITITQSTTLKINDASKVNDTDNDDTDDDTDDDTNDNAVQQSQHTTRPWNKLPNTIEALIKLIYQLRQESTQYREQFILYKNYYTALNKIAKALEYMKGNNNNDADVDNNDQLLMNQYYKTARTDRHNLLHNIKNRKRNRKTTTCDSNNESDNDDHNNESSKVRALRKIQDMKNRKRNYKKTHGYDSESDNNNSFDNNSDNDNDMDDDNDMDHDTIYNEDTTVQYQYQGHHNIRQWKKLPDTKEALIKHVYELRKQSGRYKEQFLLYKKRYTILNNATQRLLINASNVQIPNDDE